MSASPPTRIRLDDSFVLRLFRTGDSKAVALAVSESLEHLRPWMPWADNESTDERFQRQRLRGVQHKAATGEEWQYGLFPVDESRVLGSFGLMNPSRSRHHRDRILGARRRDRPRSGDTREPRPHQCRARARRHQTVYIRCDERNTRSAAVPRRLGYELERTLSRAPEAPGESGQLMIWSRRQPIS
jgi:RimJ/RimL family protein N-acetyltransferase